jgi:hypothetical protein
MTRQALELALEVLELCNGAETAEGVVIYTDKEIATIKEALAQLEQEPVAYINIEKRRLEWAYDYMSWDTPTVVNLPRIPLYTKPQQRTWVQLTDEEVEASKPPLSNDAVVWELAVEWAEAKLKEKNT